MLFDNFKFLYYRKVKAVMCKFMMLIYCSLTFDVMISVNVTLTSQILFIFCLENA